MMSNEEFKNAVREMRRAQTRYFASRLPKALKLAKELEARIDKELKENDELQLF